MKKIKLKLAKIKKKIKTISYKNNKPSLPVLSAVRNAENISQYEERLDELLSDTKRSIREIAITGPYASGKSSFLRTFHDKHNEYEYTWISLAAFKEKDETICNTCAEVIIEEEKGTDSKLASIERSIVQQIIYNTESTKTGKSRFNRIKIEKHKEIKFLCWFVFLMAAMAAVTVLFGGLEQEVYNFFFVNEPGITLKYLGTLFGFAALTSIPILFLIDGARAIGEYSISKFNPLKGDLVLEKRGKDSIFNIYIDELIYYFHVSKSDVVIFEDIDRFGTPEIFVKLKELNTLLNSCVDIKQTVKFVYALKDEVFTGSNKTKFFDSLIPIVPISSVATSYERILSILSDSGFANDFNPRFVKDISIYLDDMRILKNIVAEYGIYKFTLYKNLPTLSLENLFCYMIYKSLYSSDYSLLHKGSGALFKVLDRANKIKEKIIIERKITLNELEKVEIQSEKDSLQSIEELNAAYLHLVLNSLGNDDNIASVLGIPLRAIPNQEMFDKLMGTNGDISYKLANNSGSRAVTGKRFRDWVDEMTPSYTDRKKGIIAKSKSEKSIITEKIRTLKDEIKSISSLPVKDLLLQCDDKTDIFGKDLKMPALQYMIENGYVDEHYYLYITHFVEGSITKTDIDYVMSVIHGAETNPDYIVINPEEVLDRFSSEAYRSISFLNFSMINYLLSNGKNWEVEEFLKTAVKKDEDWVSIVHSLFNKIKALSELLSCITRSWPNILTDIVSSETSYDKKSSLVSLIISTIPLKENDIKSLLSNGDPVREFISQDECIAGNYPSTDEEREVFWRALEELNVRIQNISAASKNHSFIRDCIDNDAIEITHENIYFSLSLLLPTREPEIPDISTLLKISSPNFKGLIRANKSKFAEILARGEFYISRSEDVLEFLLEPNFSLDLKLDLIDSLDLELTNINDISEPDVLRKLITSNSIIPTWEAVSHIISDFEKVGKRPICTYLSRRNVVEKLIKAGTETAHIDDDILFSLVSDEEFPDEFFIKYLKKFDWSYSLEELPVSKVRSLIHAKIVGFTTEEFDYLVGTSTDLISLFIANGFSKLSGSDYVMARLNLDIFYHLINNEMLSNQESFQLIQQRPDLINPEENNDIVVSLIINNLAQGPSVANNLAIHADTAVGLLSGITEKKRQANLAAALILGATKNDALSIAAIIDSKFSSIADSDEPVSISGDEKNHLVTEALKEAGHISEYINEGHGLLGEIKILR